MFKDLTITFYQKTEKCKRCFHIISGNRIIFFNFTYVFLNCFVMNANEISKPMPKLQDDELKVIIEAARKGKTDAQRTIYSQFYGYGMSISVRYAENSEEAEEILNDTFMKVFKNLSKYNPNHSFKSWFRRILINTAIDYHRKYQKYRHTLGISHAYSVSVDTDTIADISAKEILALVQQLAPSYRMVFNLYVVEGFKHKEIGAQLGITTATSRATLATARHKLQKMILDNNNYNQRRANG